MILEREKGREGEAEVEVEGGNGERERQKHRLLDPIQAPNGDQTRNPGMCPDQKSNPQPFDVLLGDTPTD